jgi:hypothetical protein
MRHRRPFWQPLRAILCRADEFIRPTAIQCVRSTEDHALNTTARDDFADLLDVLHQLLNVQPAMMDAWMELAVLTREALEAGTLEILGQDIDDATTRLLGGAEQIRILALQYRGE